MNIAWLSLFITLVLLPGFLFFVGLHYSNKISKDITGWTTSGEIAGVIAISFFINVFVILLIYLISIIVPKIWQYFLTDALYFLNANQLASTERLSELLCFIIIWILITTILGFLCGIMIGRLIIHGKFRGFVQHPWVYDLTQTQLAEDVYIEVSVLTNIKHNDKTLIYKGQLLDFSVNTSGQLTYLIIENPYKEYLEFYQNHTTNETADNTSELIKDSFLFIDAKEIASLHIQLIESPLIDNKTLTELENKNF